MQGRHRFGRAVAATVLAAVVVTVGAGVAQAAPGPDPVPGTTTAFDSYPDVVLGNYPSVGYQATATAELGDLVALEPGTGRTVRQITVGMSAWGCESYDGAGKCVTTPGATWTHPLTLTVYAVAGTDAAPVPGAVVWQQTMDATIPYRPSTDARCTAPDAYTQGRWYSEADGTCYYGYLFPVTFTPATTVTLPDEVIVTVAYSTQTYGAAPIGTDGPYNSLNYALVESTDSTELAAGSDVDPDTVFWNARDTSWSLVQDSNWYYTPLVQILTAPDASVAAVSAPRTATKGAAVSVSATLAGTAFPAGTTLVLAAYADCAAAPVYVSDPLPVSAAGAVGPLTFTPAATGTLSWVATLSDGTATVSASTCGAVTTQVLAAEELAATGTGDTGPGALVALAAILAGAALVAISRRRAAAR
jgi:hypothetical protein